MDDLGGFLILAALALFLICAVLDGFRSRTKCGKFPNLTVDDSAPGDFLSHSATESSPEPEPTFEDFDAHIEEWFANQERKVK